MNDLQNPLRVFHRAFFSSCEVSENPGCISSGELIALYFLFLITKRMVRMIRAFTISFDFEGKTYLALASIKTAAEGGDLYTVHIYDDSLARIVPERTFSYYSKKPLCPQTLKHPFGLKLFSCINEALVHHLQVSRVAH